MFDGTIGTSETGKEIISCRTSTGISSVIGNEVNIIKHYFKSLFPKGYFKDEYIETKLFAKEIADKINEFDSSNRLKKPALVIKPRISFSPDDTYMENMGHYFYKNYYIYKDMQTNYEGMIQDPTTGVSLYTLCDRMNISYEISIITNTQIDAWNIGGYFKGSVLQDSYFYLRNMYMEAVIPRSFIDIIGKYFKYNLSKPEDCKKLQTYLNQWSKGLVTLKQNFSNGLYEFFYQYGTNILCKFDQFPSVDTGSESSQTNDMFTMTTNLITEFWTPFNFFLEIPIEDKELKELIEAEFGNYMNESLTEPDQFTINETYPNPNDTVDKKEIDISEKNVSVVDTRPSKTTNVTIKPKVESYYTESEMRSKNTEENQLLLWQGYIVDNETEVDTLEFGPVVEPYLVEYINYCVKNNSEEFLDIITTKLFLGKVPVKEDSYEIDWRTFTLLNKQPIKNNTYFLGVYGPKEYIQRQATKYRMEKGLNNDSSVINELTLD